MMSDAGGLVEQNKSIMTVNNRVRYVNKTIKKNRSCNNNKRIRKDVVFPRVPQLLQQLYVSCTEIFKGHGTVPSTSDVNKLCNILDKVKLEDFGLNKNLPFFKETGAGKGTPRVTYTNIYQCDKFSLCIFFLPVNAVIPLHNHPEMTVFNKLLLGKMHIKSYDWVDPNDSMQPSQLRLVRLKANRVYTAPCDTSVLYPTTGGNIHQFTAITPCAVLDVIGPPYSKEDGRDCSYYKDYAFSDRADGGTTRMSEEERNYFGWLEEIEVPENSEMDRIEYLGPQILENSSY